MVVQLRVGGQTARRSDETLPVGHGCFGQETTGPGGLAKALRTVPVVLEVAEAMAARSAPGAWLVDFTNPVGIVTQALLDEGHRAVGLCNVARWVQRRLGHYLGGSTPTPSSSSTWGSTTSPGCARPRWTGPTGCPS